MSVPRPIARGLRLLVPMALLHFAATAGTQFLSVSRCGGGAGTGCSLVDAAASLLAQPLVPVFLELMSGTIGWRRAMVLFGINSFVVGLLLVGAVGLLGRILGGRRA